MHPADLFIVLRQHLDRDPKETERAAKRLESAPDEAGRLLRRLTDLLESDDGAEALRDWIDRSGERTKPERRVLAAQAIDRWYAPLATRYVTRGGSTRGHPQARQRFKRYGRFNGNPADGQLILRPGLFDRSVNIREVTPPRESFDAADLFHNLLLLPPTLPAECPHGQEGGRPVSVTFHRIAEVADQCPSDPDWAPVVAVVPLAQAEDDLAVRTFSQDGADWYAAVPRSLGDRAAAAIDALAAEGATVVVFPEVTADSATLDAIKAAVRRQAVDGPIRYVLVGVRQEGGAEDDRAGHKPRSMAVLLDRTGCEVFRQTKLHCWDLDDGQCRSYDVRGPDGRLLDGAKEFIEPGDGITIVELPNMGRLAVMICEDLGREQPAAWLCRAKLLDWIVTPVMDAGLTEERWQAHAGDESSRAGSCRVVVANSMSFSHRFNRVRAAEGREDERITDCGVALFFQPRADPAHVSRIRRLALPIDAPDPGYVAARWEPRRWPELKTGGCP